MGFYKTKEIDGFFLLSKEKKTILELKISGNGKNERSVNFLFLTNKGLKMT